MKFVLIDPLIEKKKWDEENQRSRESLYVTPN